MTNHDGRGAPRPLDSGGRRGFTLIELLIVAGIIAVVAALAVPQLLSARRSGNHASAIASLRAISSAEVAYSSACAHGAFATALPQLAQVPSGMAPFISPDLSSDVVVRKSGYNLTVGAGSDSVPGSSDACNGVSAGELASTFYATAVPLVAGATGNWYFWVGMSGTVFQDTVPISSTVGHATAPGGRPIQ